MARGGPGTRPDGRMLSCGWRNRLHEAHGPTLICIEKGRGRIYGHRRLDYLGDCEIEHLEPQKTGGRRVGERLRSLRNLKRGEGDGTRKGVQDRQGCPVVTKAAREALEAGPTAGKRVPEG